MGNCNNKNGGGGGGGKNKQSKKSGLKINSSDKHSTSPQEQKLEAKVVLIGNSGVGKTSIALRFKDGTFSDNPSATVGASYFQKVMTLKDGTQLRLHIWDTGGAEKFKSVAPLYYRGAHAAIVCYSVMDELSFRGTEEWL